jgi:hypothetical protein
MGNFLVAIDRSEGKAGPAIFVMTEQEYNEVSQLWHDNPSCVSKDGELMFDDRYGFEIYGYTTLQAAVESVKALDDYDELLKNNEIMYSEGLDLSKEGWKDYSSPSNTSIPEPVEDTEIEDYDDDKEFGGD